MKIDRGRNYAFSIHSGILFLGLVSTASAGMKSLDDSELASVSGQSGITLEMYLGVTADKVSYYDDGKGIHLEGFRVGSASDPNGSAHHVIKVDIGVDASLNLDYLVEDRRIEFGDIRLAGAPGLSMGGIFLDHSLQGYVNIKQGGATGGAGYTFDTAYTMTGGRLGYRTNGNEFFLDGITMDVEALGITLDVVGDTLKLDAPRIVGNWQVEAIRYSGNPLNHGVSTDTGSGALLPSYGGISSEFDLSSSSDIRAGGREGEGLRFDNQTTIHSASFLYHDDANVLALRNITGYLNVQDSRLDVTLNVTREEVRGGAQFFDGLRIGFENVKAGYRINGLKVGSDDAQLQGGTISI